VKATSSESCPSTAETGQFVGTQIEATVVPIGDNQFGVSVVFSERGHVGCRDVNGLSIPVFSNQTIAHTINLINGEFREIVLQSDTLRNKTTKMNVTLMVGN